MLFLSLTPRVYTEEQPGDAAIMLFIKNLRGADTGKYTCRGIYANNEEMTAQVEIKTFSECYILYRLLKLAGSWGAVTLLGIV